MAKYRKRPIIVEATQWFKNGDHPEDDCEIFDCGDGKFKGEGKVVKHYRTPALDGQSNCKYCGGIMHNHGWIDTVQGGHVVCPGDWIITDDNVEKGNHGHYYPCKPSIFKETYGKID